jgi:hypothetical protein
MVGIDMDFASIEIMLEDYFYNHFYEKTEKLELNLFYHIKEHQKDNYPPALDYYYFESKVIIYPSLEVTSIVVSPREPK